MLLPKSVNLLANLLLLLLLALLSKHIGLCCWWCSKRSNRCFIQGGDVGQSALIGGAGGAGASVARELAAAAEYDVPAFSDQSRQLVSQDVGVNRFSDIGADLGTALGRAAITGDVEGELQTAAQGVTSREVADLLRDEFSPSTASEEPDQQEEMVAQAAEESDIAEAENIIAEAVETNPIFAEDLQVAQIAVGDDQQLTTNEKLDVLAESLAREEFDKVAQSEDVAILPVFAAPLVERCWSKFIENCGC
jgi:hypothetical protein